ncbi:MAG: hypothetical protein AAGA40_16590 [Cyanobacteria bacterium P01_E01_bin.45]
MAVWQAGLSRPTFCGGAIASDAGLLLLKQVKRQFGITEWGHFIQCKMQFAE